VSFAAPSYYELISKNAKNVAVGLLLHVYTKATDIKTV